MQTRRGKEKVENDMFDEMPLRERERGEKKMRERGEKFNESKQVEKRKGEDGKLRIQFV